MALTGYALGIVKRSIRRAYSLDISGRFTLFHLRELGYHIGTSRFFDLRREVLATFPIPPAAMFGEPRKPLSQMRHVASEDNFPTKYRYIVGVDAVSELTGTAYTFETGIYSDKRLSQGDLEQVIADRFNGAGSPVHSLEFEGSFVGIATVQAFRHR